METMTVSVAAEATGSSAPDPPKAFTGGKDHKSRLPPFDAYRSKENATNVTQFPRKFFLEEASSPLHSSDLEISLPKLQSKESLAYPSIKQSSSFSFPSPATPSYPQLNYSVSSPALPFFPENAIDSSQSGKYRPRTRSPSDGADVRWYFCKTPLGPNEAAASVPPLELVGKGEYFRFSVSDSATLEAAFLEREEELVSAWWKEYAECREGPSSAASTSSNAAPSESKIPVKSSTLEFSKYRSSRILENLSEDDESVGVIVKGGLYEVDLRQRRCSPVYWRGDHRRVLRGHWFALKGGLDWLPLREDIAEQLEIAYESQIWRRRRFQPSGLFAARVNLHGATEGLHALFTGEDDSWEAWLCVDATRISFVLGLRGSDVRLRRGFILPESAQPTQDEIRQRKEEEMDDYASKVPVRHVVFMVHGIGQRLEKANLVDDVGTFRHTVSMLAEQHLTQYQRNAQRVLFIPCQWRRGLKLGGESAVEDCTLEGVRALRTMLSATVHDVLYYMSPVYCQDIIDSVSSSLNRLYGKFIKRNPNYDGKVSIYGHSLGSVLSYDILCHQKTLTSLFPIIEVRPEEGENSGEVCPEEVLSEDGELSSRDSVARGSACDVEQTELESKGEFDRHRQNLDGEDLQTGHVALGHDESYESPDAHETCKETAHDVQEVDGMTSDTDSDASVVQKTELEILREEVKMLREKLASFTVEQSAPNDLRLLPTSEPDYARSSGGLGMSERDNREDDDTGRCDDEGPRASDSNHSLGDARRNPLGSKTSSKKNYTPYISYSKLDFQVDTFYAVGSPLGVFLSLRNIRLGEGSGQDYWNDEGVEEEMPCVRQMMNIFHPYDPVAYRIEPLVCKEFVHKRPTFIPYHKGGKRLHIGMQEFGEDLSARSKAIVDSLSSVGTRMASAFTISAAEKKDDENLEVVEKEKTYGESMMERLTGGPDGRLDYMLQDATFEHQYISVISSHTSYWHDLDTALFILKHLYKDIPQEAPPVNVPSEEIDGVTRLRRISEDDGPDFPDTGEGVPSIKLEDDSDFDDLPLTFSGKDGIAAILANAKNVNPCWNG